MKYGIVSRLSYKPRNKQVYSIYHIKGIVCTSFIEMVYPTTKFNSLYENRENNL